MKISVALTPETLTWVLTGSGNDMPVSASGTKDLKSNAASRAASKSSVSGASRSTDGKVQSKSPTSGASRSTFGKVDSGRKSDIKSNGRPRDQKTGASPGRAIPDKNVRDNWNKATFAQKRDYITAKAIDEGLPPVVAAGFAGNFFAESSYKHNAVNRGDSRKGADSVHLGQWNDERLAELHSRYGKNPTIDQQIKFAADEIRGLAGDKIAPNVMKEYNKNPNMTPREAATSIFDNFERGSKKARADSLETRQQVADQAYSALNNQQNFAPIGTIKAPSIVETVKKVPSNIPGVETFKKLGEIGRKALKGEKQSSAEIADAATSGGVDLAGVLAGPFGGVAAGFIKNKIDKEIKGLSPSQDTINAAKTWAGFAGGLLGGPLGIATGIAGASIIDAAGNPTITAGTQKPAPRISGPSDGGKLMLNGNGSPSLSLPSATIPRGGAVPLSQETPSANVEDQTNSGAVSLYDALFDPAYNPLSSTFWNGAAWNFGLVVLALSLVAFGAYSMVSKSSSTNLTVVNPGAA